MDRKKVVAGQVYITVDDPIRSEVDTGRDALVARGRAVPWLGTLTVGALVVYVIIRIVRRGTTERVEPGEDVEDEEST